MSFLCTQNLALQVLYNNESKTPKAKNRGMIWLSTRNKKDPVMIDYYLFSLLRLRTWYVRCFVAADS